MGEVINLNKARKARARQAEVATAAVNRVRFGRTRVEKTLRADEQDRAIHRLDQRRLSKPTTVTPTGDEPGDETGSR